MTKQPPMRRSAASRLRALADRLDPRQQDVTEPERPSAPLVRFGGHWWPRDEILGPPADAQAPTDELHP